MKNKGFTLVELLCVIIIIAVISVIVFPMVAGHINDSKEELDKVQISDLEAAAEKWSINNLDKMDKYHINDIIVTIAYLKQEGYLEKDTILKPSTKEEMDGVVLIRYNFNTKQYSYKYLEIDGDLVNDPNKYLEIDGDLVNDQNESLKFEVEEDNYESESYILYYYNVDHLTSEIYNAKSHNPFYLDIINRDDIKVNGEEEAGLYELENEYVFRGNEDNDHLLRNYVDYAGKTWRILSIDKNDYSMKLISTSCDNYGSWSPDTEIDYSKVELFDNEEFIENTKLIDVWDNGDVATNPMSLNDLRNSLSMKQINKKIGMISLYDFAVASTSCSDNILDVSCFNNNYLATMFSGKNVWTMNTDGNKIWYISSINSFGLEYSNAATYYRTEVIKVPVGVYNTKPTATGEMSNMYVLK